MAFTLAACTPAPPPAQEPEAGGPSPSLVSPPARPMDRLERQVAARLAAGVRDDGLALEHLDCPAWRGHLPDRLRCTGWFDGVEGDVSVRLMAGAHDRVAFDAALTGGVVATHSVVERLLGVGYVDVDCGTLPAYPAQVGLRLVCLATHDGEHGHVVATVSDPDGSVTISEP